MTSKNTSDAVQNDLLAELVENKTSPTLSDADQIMLRYAVQLTKDPASITNHDIDELRILGFDDRGIHDICAVTAYFAFVNRMADGLGVKLEERFSKSII